MGRKTKSKIPNRRRQQWDVLVQKVHERRVRMQDIARDREAASAEARKV